MGFLGGGEGGKGGEGGEEEGLEGWELEVHFGGWVGCETEVVVWFWFGLVYWEGEKKDRRPFGELSSSLG